MQQGLYRGFCKKCGVWVEGNLIQGFHGEKYILDNNPDDAYYHGLHPVDPVSVGKYSGFDTPGEYLYGGDICKDQNGYMGVVLYNKESGTWVWIREDSEIYRLADVFNNLDFYGTLYEDSEEDTTSNLIDTLMGTGILKKVTEGGEQ